MSNVAQDSLRFIRALLKYPSFGSVPDPEKDNYIDDVGRLLRYVVNGYRYPSNAVRTSVQGWIEEGGIST
jgi:hypothetical protein